MSNHYFSPHPKSREERGLIRAKIRGLDLEFTTNSGVFSHTRVDNGTRLLAESMMVPIEGRLLDLGCGYGVLGIVAAKASPRLEVVMTDVNQRATTLAEENLKRNGVVNARVVVGSLYEPVEGEMFDAIVTNPPISAGIGKTVSPIVSGSPDHLNSGGSLQLVVQSNKGGRTVACLVEAAFGEAEVLARGSGYRVLRGVKKQAA